jgi:putative membrane protein
MKTIIKNIIGSAIIIAIASLAACTNTNSNNATYAADSANKTNIAKTDSANKAGLPKADSTKANVDSIKQKTELKEDASKFLVKVYESGLYEIEISQLAAKKGTNADVKSLAEKLVTAHKGINDKMLKIAFNANYKLPGGINSDHAKAEGDLAKLTGADFDKKYMDIIVSGHQKSVDAYTDATKTLSTGVTKEFATSTLHMIKDHLTMAKAVKDKLK